MYLQLLSLVKLIHQVRETAKIITAGVEGAQIILQQTLNHELPTLVQTTTVKIFSL